MKFTYDNAKIKTPTFIKPGVDKQAFGDLVKGAMKTGELVHQNYQIGSLRDEINTKTKEYEDTNAQYEAGMQAGQVAGGQQMAIDALWEGAAESPVDTQTTAGAINKLETEYKANLDKFQAARSQGKISEEELVARINKTTREFVNRNPWMEQELYQAAQTHLKNTGIADILKYRTDLAEAASKETRDDYKAIRNQLLQAGVPGGWYPGMPMDEMMRNLMTHNKVEYTTKMWDNWDKVSKAMDRQTIKDMLPSLQKDGIYAITSSRGREWANGLSTLTNPNDIAAYKYNMQVQARNEVQLMRIRLSQEGVAGTEEGKQVIQDFEKSLNDMISGLDSVASGKTASEILKNRSDILELDQRIQVRSQINMEAWKAMTDVLPYLPKSAQDNLIRKSGAADKVQDQFAKLLDMDYKNTPPVQEFVKKGTANYIFGEIIKQGEQDPTNPSLVNGMKMTAKGISAALTNPNMTDEDRYISINASFAAIARGQKFFAAQSPDSEFITTIKPQVDFMMKKYAPGIVTAAKDIMANIPYTEIVYDVTPSGGLVVYSNNSEVASKLNKSMVTQINNALDTWANVNGISRKEAAQTFFPQYFGDLLSNDPDLGGTGQNPTPPTGQSSSKTQTAPLPETPPILEKPLAQGETPEMRALSNETVSMQAQRNAEAERIIALEKADLEKQLKADKAALRVAQGSKTDDPKYIKWLEDRIKMAEDRLSPEGARTPK
jgi:hypothetical protein